MDVKMNTTNNYENINPVDETKLSCYTSHRCSTTVSLETYPSILLFLRLRLLSELSKTLFNLEDFKNAFFSFLIEGKHFENGAFRKR